MVCRGRAMRAMRGFFIRVIYYFTLQITEREREREQESEIRWRQMTGELGGSEGWWRVKSCSESDSQGGVELLCE